MADLGPGPWDTLIPASSRTCPGSTYVPFSGSRLCLCGRERRWHIWAPDGRGALTGIQRHDFTGPGPCPHFDCGSAGTGDVQGWQCADCGHYFPRTRVAFGPDSEPRCRATMGHNAPGGR